MAVRYCRLWIAGSSVKTPTDKGLEPANANYADKWRFDPNVSVSFCSLISKTDFTAIKLFTLRAVIGSNGTVKCSVFAG